jgi:hypothetical protein
VNGPNALLSPSVNVVVTVIVPAPPQHAGGNPLDDVVPNDADIGIVALNKLQLTGVTLTSATTVSGTPSPFVSHASVAAVVTVLPGLCNGTPVSASKPWHIVVTSFGKNPHPISCNWTAHSEFTNPVDPGVVTNGPATTV